MLTINFYQPIKIQRRYQKYKWEIMILIFFPEIWNLIKMDLISIITWRRQLALHTDRIQGPQLFRTLFACNCTWFVQYVRSRAPGWSLCYQVPGRFQAVQILPKSIHNQKWFPGPIQRKFTYSFQSHNLFICSENVR